MQQEEFSSLVVDSWIEINRREALIKNCIKWLSCLATFCSIFLLISSNEGSLLHPLGITRFVPVSGKISRRPLKLSQTDEALVGEVTTLLLLIESCLILRILFLIKDTTNPKLVTAGIFSHMDLPSFGKLQPSRRLTSKQLEFQLLLTIFLFYQVKEHIKCFVE